MGDDAPNPVVLMIDTQDPYCRPGASGRPAALGVSTKAVDSAVQRHKHAVEIDHTDGAHIAVAHHILLQRLLIGVLHRLLHRGGHSGVVAVTAIHLQHSHQNTLARLIMLRGVHPALVGQFPEGDIALRAEQVHKDARSDDGYDPCLGADGCPPG